MVTSTENESNLVQEYSGDALTVIQFPTIECTQHTQSNRILTIRDKRVYRHRHVKLVRMWLKRRVWYIYFDFAKLPLQSERHATHFRRGMCFKRNCQHPRILVSLSIFLHELMHNTDGHTKHIAKVINSTAMNINIPANINTAAVPTWSSKFAIYSIQVK